MVLLEPTKSKTKTRTVAATSSPATVAKRVSEAVRDLVALMIQKGAYGWSTWRSGRKMMISTAAVAERGKLLSRSFNDLVLRHNTALGCTSHDVRLSFVSPRDYEFSCTSSPPPRLRRHRHSTSSSSSSRHHHHHHHHYDRHVSKRRSRGGFVNIDHHYGGYKPSRVVLRPVEDWNEVDDVARAKSSSINSYYGGGGSGEGGGDEFPVDKAAEEFIERFYRELLMQKWTAAREGSDRIV